MILCIKKELPDRERMDNIFIDIRNLAGYGGGNMQTIYMDNYIKQVYELIYGKGEKPWWMKD